jgi:bifunctional non-homologous end joining protein LigD
MATSSTERVRTIEQRLGELEKATLTKNVPVSESFVYELKYDGYRFLAIKAGRSVRLVSRRGLDWAEKFPSIVGAVAELAPKELAIDGEVCALDAHGVPSFNLMQNARGNVPIVYIVFDALWLDGRDLRGEPLEVRREELERIVGRGRKGPISVSTAVRGDPKEVLRAACARGFEGIVAKRRGSHYVGGRTKDWLKIKCSLRQEFAIVGYLPLVNTTNVVGSLLLAVFEDGAFHFVGKVGTGFTDAKRRELARTLATDRIEAPPVAGAAPRIRDARWVKPRYAAEVAFTEWTPSGNIRHPAFQGIRIDKTAKECVRERAA